MRWLTFIIAAGLVLTLQVAGAPRLEIFGCRPDLLLVFVVYVAMYAEPGQAFIGAWSLGFMADLMTLERLGFLAVSYGLVALLVIGCREFIFCQRRSTRFYLTAMLTIVIKTLWLTYAHLLHGYGESFLGVWVLTVVPAGIYTGLCAIPLHGTLDVFSRLLGFVQPRYSHQGLSRMAGGRV
ncbi:MAG: rod shape-determining protein MreD [Phycisphaerae bacterium]